MSQASTANHHARGWTQALTRAAEEGDAARAGELLAAGATADVRLEGGATPLMRAAARGFADVARVLLDAGADPNARRGDGFTPLILAVFFGHEEVVRLLLERGADPSAQTHLGVSARGWAASRGFEAIGDMLRRAPAPAVPAAVAPRPPVTVTVVRPGGEAVTIERVLGEREVARERESTAGLEKRPVPPAAPTREAAPYEPQFYPPPRGFAWSWQASVGVVLLVAAGGFGGFALWQQSRSAANDGRAPSPSAAGATQAARPLPTPSAPDPAAQLTPTPPVDIQGGAVMPGMPGVVIIPPDPSALPPAAMNPAGLAPSVVSENAPAPTPEESAPRRDPRDARGEVATPDAPAGRRDEQPREDDAARPSNAVRRDRPTEAETQPAPRPSDPQPAPSATPRRRVIQWPP